MDQIIGVAGCGRMGAGMLANLRKAGFDDMEFARDCEAPDNTIGISVKDVEAALVLGGDKTLPKALQRAIRCLKSRDKP